MFRVPLLLRLARCSGTALPANGRPCRCSPVPDRAGRALRAMVSMPLRLTGRNFGPVLMAASSGENMTDRPFREILLEVLPVLRDNFAVVHEDYMAGAIPAGAMRYARDRLTLAEQAACNDGLCQAKFFGPQTLDLAEGLNLPKWSQRAPELMDRWMSALRAAGLTGTHPIFGFPVAPRDPVEAA